VKQTAVEQTKAVFQPLKARIAEAVNKLEEQIALGEGGGAPEAEVEQAKTVLAQAKAA
jgi:tubulin-specific chaperone A